MSRTTVLFLCLHNSARSQMAEAFTHHLGAEKVRAHSAGLQPGKLNPLVVQSMREGGIDLSGKKTTAVDDLHAAGETFDYIVTVCDREAAERCPIFPGQAVRLHWPFPDPSRLEGTEAEKRGAVREIRDAIRAKVESWLADL